MMNRFKNEKGFTLVELLIAMAIIGILIALLIPAANLTRRNAADTVKKSDLQGIQLLIEDYYGINRNRYPSVGDFEISGNTISLGDNSIELSFNGTVEISCDQSERNVFRICYSPAAGNQSYVLSVLLESGEAFELGQD